MKTAVLFDKYFVLGMLGVGGTGQVLLVEHIYLHTKRAVKKIEKGNITRESFVYETTILKNLKHPCIPVIYDIEEDESSYYIVEEYIEGESMSSYFSHVSCDIQDILDYAIQICDILEYIHFYKDGAVVHLDIKPQNLLIQDKKVYLVDFGSSVNLRERERQYCMGTDFYSSPEQAKGKKPDVRSDIYSFGKVLGFMFGQSGISLDKRMTSLIERCISSNADERFSTIKVVKRFLVQIKSEHINCQIQSQSVQGIHIYGVRAGSGVTHFALALTRWLNVHGMKACYVENNTSGHAVFIKRYSNRTCPVVPRYGKTIEYIPEEGIIVRDWGSDTAAAERQEGLHILVSGGRTWEVEESENIIRNSNAECLVFNYIDSKNFAMIRKSFDMHVYGMKYMKDVFSSSENDEMLGQLVCENIPLVLKGSIKGGKIISANRKVWPFGSR